MLSGNVLAMNAEVCKAAVQSLAGVLESPACKEWRSTFVRANVQVFEYGEENKLEYTAVHNQFVAGLEQLLSSALPSGTSMRELEQALVAQPDLFQDLGGDEATTSAVKVLLEAGDFLAFRDMMQYEKQRVEESDAPIAGLEHVQGSAVPLLEQVSDEVLERCHRLAALAGSPGWENVLTSDWIVIDKMPIDGSPGEMYLRGAWTMNLSVVECCDMMFSYDGRRRSWDKNFIAVTLQKGQSLQDDDVVLTSEIDFGFLMHAVGVPRLLTTRLHTRWDHPTPGAVTGTLMPWKMPADEFDAVHPIMSVKVTSIAPHSIDPKKCVMTTVEANKMGRLPRWALSMLISVTAPQLMKGLEGRYISAVRNTGTTNDVTKFTRM